MGGQFVWGVDNYKTLSIVGGQRGSNYYYGEKLVWWPAFQLQARFRLEVILKTKRVLEEKIMTSLNNIISLKNCKLMVINFVGLRWVWMGCH